MTLQAASPRLILASASAARRALLEGAGLVVQALPADIDERAVKQAAQGECRSAADTALLLAELKARRIAAADAIILGADQMLVCDGAWFDKPADIAAARAQLLALRGRRHELISAVVAYEHGTRVWQHVARAHLHMRTFSLDFLDAYLAAEGPAALHSVGAYRLEGLGIQLFDSVEGEHSTILGLPLLALLQWLRGRGVVLG